MFRKYIRIPSGIRINGQCTWRVLGWRDGYLVIQHCGVPRESTSCQMLLSPADILSPHEFMLAARSQLLKG